jgi:regulator of protease activity HflC (stomatin/prohibitin superfamily)
MDAIGGLVMVAIFAFLVLGLVALAKGARTVKQYEKGLITRLGKYHGMAPSGLTFIVPFVDDIVRVDMREQVITVPPAETHHQRQRDRGSRRRGVLQSDRSGEVPI